MKLHIISKECAFIRKSSLSYNAHAPLSEQDALHIIQAESMIRPNTKGPANHPETMHKDIIVSAKIEQAHLVWL